MNRRTVLRGLGASVALPALECMLDVNGVAYASNGGPIPKRFATWFFGNGVRLDRWVPGQTGANWELSSEMALLAPVKDYVNVVSGYTVHAAGPRGHHGGESGMLSGVEFIELEHPNSNYSSKFGGPSIDQLVATAVGGAQTPPSVQIGVSKRYVTSEGPTLQFISHRSPDVSLPPEYNPATLFTRMFGSFTPPTDPRSRMRVNVLDAVLEDIRALKLKLGTNDKNRLDAHLTGINELRGRILALPPEVTGACQPGITVSSTNDDVNGVEPLQEVSDIMSDLLVLIYACDLTRVASVMFTGSVGFTVFDMVGATAGHHDLTHDASAEAQELVHQSTIYTVGQFAKLCEKLKNTVEGDGNLLDHSLLFMTSDCDEGLTHENKDYPIILAGKAGGAMRYPGVHRRGIPGFHNTNDALMSILTAMDTGIAGIGNGFIRSTRTISEIMA